MKIRYWLRRTHIWLGWLVGVPLLLWTASGLFMAVIPIETIRAEHMVGEPPVLAVSAPPIAPVIGPRPVASLMLEQRADGPRWILRYADGGARLADPVTGGLLPSLSAADAAKAVAARYTGTARIVAIDRISAADPPLELRRPVASWRVGFDDGTRFYVDAATGEILARRTDMWRVYDFLWGLHIMDLQTRVDFNHGWLIVFASISLASIVMALVLLPMSVWKKRGQ